MIDQERHIHITTIGYNMSNFRRKKVSKKEMEIWDFVMGFMLIIGIGALIFGVLIQLGIL